MVSTFEDPREEFIKAHNEQFEFVPSNCAVYELTVLKVYT